MECFYGSNFTYFSCQSGSTVNFSLDVNSGTCFRWTVRDMTISDFTTQIGVSAGLLTAFGSIVQSILRLLLLAFQPRFGVAAELEELKKKTTFSEKEIREWYAGFMHDCPDGELDKKTFTRIFKQFYLHDDNKADSFCNYVFEMFDEDGNKTMSFKEFLLAICPSTQGELKKRLELVFDM
ncbi:unnamed protein product [Rotaria sp. Silwood1]|nr:unnamed protein product [Rotaria sp. Silwood1]CAF1551889.1 unnamed protein product [Rotaria sp. Silwood1]CAF3711400.1 unnamed protein product [Rotaria sp. Silwood1]CAF3733794.1 unnamed protein product [Rotaria sp. Silwood1]